MPGRALCHFLLKSMAGLHIAVAGIGSGTDAARGGYASTDRAAAAESLKTDLIKEERSAVRKLKTPDCLGQFEPPPAPGSARGISKEGIPKAFVREFSDHGRLNNGHQLTLCVSNALIRESRRSAC